MSLSVILDAILSHYSCLRLERIAADTPAWFVNN